MKKHKVRPYRDSQRPHLKYVVNVKEEGKRSRSFFETKKEADTFAEQKNIELLNGGIEAAQFSSALRVMAREAATTLAPFGKTIRDAIKFYLPHLQAINRTCTAAQLAEELVKVKESDGASARYLGDLRNRLKQFATSFDGKPVAEITSTEIDNWLRGLSDSQTGKPLAATSRNNFRRVLMVAFNFAQDRGYCVGNPVEKTAKAKAIQTAPGILTVDETSRLLESAPEELVPYIAIAAFAGLRRAELERLDWKEVDLQSCLIEVMASKAKSARRRFVKIKPNLLLWLKPYAQSRGAVTPPDYSKLLDKAREGAGIKTWPNNALRHGFASYYLAHFKRAGAAELALELGHTNSNLVFQHYRQLVRPKEAKRYWSITPTATGRKILRLVQAA
jgi:integrase